MPKPQRSDFSGSFYHVVARGNQKQKLFFQQQDYLFYLDLLKTSSLDQGLDIFHYVLMPNHVHLLVRPRQDGALGRTFHWVQRKFAYRFHRQHGTEGSVWQGRYWNSEIDGEGYLLACGRYIELNPVRAGLARIAEEYPWSSAKVYLQGDKNPWIMLDPAFLDLGGTDAERTTRYREFIQEAQSATSVQTTEWAFWDRLRISNQVVPG